MQDACNTAPMTDDSTRDFLPFPDPKPEPTGFGPLDSDDMKEWHKDRRRWEAVHGRPEDAPRQ